MSHMCKRIFKSELQIKKLLTKYQIFTIYPQISHFHKFCNFSSKFAIFETNCFIPINFIAGACQEYSFSFLPVFARLNDCSNWHEFVWRCVRSNTKIAKSLMIIIQFALIRWCSRKLEQPNQMVVYRYVFAQYMKHFPR